VLFTQVRVWRSAGGFRVTLSDTRIPGQRPQLVSGHLNDLVVALTWVKEQVEICRADPEIDLLDVVFQPNLHVPYERWVVEIIMSTLAGCP
jgi:hypothetical protein